MVNYNLLNEAARSRSDWTPSDATKLGTLISCQHQRSIFALAYPVPGAQLVLLIEPRA